MKITLTVDEVVMAIKEHMAHDVFDGNKSEDDFMVESYNITGEIQVTLKGEEDEITK